MTTRPTRDDARPDIAPPATDRPASAPSPRPAAPASNAPARSAEEAEARYVAARDAWTAAMRAAGSGRSADLASLAIAQEAYEAATRERDLWSSGSRTEAIQVAPEPTRSAIDVIVGQELAWRRVHHEDEEPKRGFLGRIGRKLRGR
jgi:hypothetical protein